MEFDCLVRIFGIRKLRRNVFRVLKGIIFRIFCIVNLGRKRISFSKVRELIKKGLWDLGIFGFWYRMRFREVGGDVSDGSRFEVLGWSRMGFGSDGFREK